jgi:hypothetical protein
MADDDPLAGYTPSKNPTTAVAPAAPSSNSSDPLAGYTPSVAAAASSAPAGGSSFDPSWKPSGSPLWDLLTRPIAKTEYPLPAARDYGLSMWDTATGGFGVPASLKGATAQAHANLGPIMDPIAGTLAYAAGPGRLLGPLAGKIVGAVAPSVSAFGAPLAARIAGGVGAGAIEGGAAAGLGATGHGGSASDIAKATALGTLVGGGTSGLTAGAGALTGGEAGAAAAAGGPIPRGPSAADVGKGWPITPGSMQSKMTNAYAPLDNIYFDSPTVSGGLNQAQAGLRLARDPQGQGADLGIPDDVNNIVAKLQSNPVATGTNLQQASAALRRTGDQTGHRFADALDNTLATAQPMSINGVPTGQVGEAAEARAAGDVLYGQIKGLNRLGTDPAQLTPGAVAKTASFYQPGTPEAQSLSALQTATQPGFNWWHVRHAAGPLLGAGLGAAEGYFNPAEGQNPWVRAATEGAEGMALFSGLPAIAAARPGPALNAARYAIGTGQPMTTATGRLGDALLSLVLGRAASNQAPY